MKAERQKSGGNRLKRIFIINTDEVVELVKLGEVKKKLLKIVVLGSGKNTF